MTKLFLALLAIVAMLAIACGDDDDKSSATTAPATSTATKAATSTGAASKTITSTELSPSITFTADDSWAVDADVPAAFVLKRRGDATYPTGYIEVVLPTEVYAVDGLTKEPLPSDFAAWLKANSRVAHNGDSETTIGGRPAARIDIASSGDADIKLFELADGPVGVDYNERLRFYVVDGDDGPIVIAIHTTPGPLLNDFLPIADPVVETAKIGS